MTEVQKAEWQKACGAVFMGVWAVVVAYLRSAHATAEVVTYHLGTPDGWSHKQFQGPLLYWLIRGAKEQKGKGEHVRILIELIRCGKVLDPNVTCVDTGNKWSWTALYAACYYSYVGSKEEQAKATYELERALLAGDAAGLFQVALDVNKKWTNGDGTPRKTPLAQAVFWSKPWLGHVKLLAAHPRVDVEAVDEVRGAACGVMVGCVCATLLLALHVASHDAVCGPWCSVCTLDSGCDGGSVCVCV